MDKENKLEAWFEDNLDKLVNYTNYLLSDNSDEGQELYSELEDSLIKEFKIHHKLAFNIIKTGTRIAIKRRFNGEWDSMFSI